jgi:hypothetical protein
VGEDRQDATGPPSAERVSVPQAADHLGTTVDALRKRVQRGTIPHERDRDGRVWILLDTGRPRQDTDQDTDRPQSDSTALISAKDETIATLREQLQAERQAHAEARRIIAGLVERIPAIEAPSEERESPETVEEAPDRAEPRSATVEAQDERDTERARREMAETTLHEGMTEERRRREEAERERDDLRRKLHGLREGRESSQMAEEHPGRGQPHSATVRTQEGTQRPRSRPWWRRIIGG